MNTDSSTEQTESGRRKLYIMAMAATGKSTLVRRNEYYPGYRVAGFALRIPEFSFLTRAFLYRNRIMPPLRRVTVKRPDLAGPFNVSCYDPATIEPISRPNIDRC